MYKFAIAFMTLFLAGCCCDPSYVPSYRRDNGAADAPVYRKTARRAAYTKYVAPKGDVIHAAGFDIQQGQQMRDFFDDFAAHLPRRCGLLSHRGADQGRYPRREGLDLPRYGIRQARPVRDRRCFGFAARRAAGSPGSWSAWRRSAQQAS